MTDLDASRSDILFLDHSGIPGGGQLGLARYVMGSKLRGRIRIAILSGGQAFDSLRDAGMDIQVATMGRFGIRALLRSRAWLSRLVRSTSPAIVVTNSIKSTVVLATTRRRAGVRYVCYMRDDLNPRRNPWTKRLLVGWALRRFDDVIANSEWTTSTLPSFVNHASVPVAYPVSGVDRQGARTDRDPGDPLRVLSLSRIARWKGIHVLIEAADLLARRGYRDRFTLTVAGGSLHAAGAYEAEVRRAASTSSADITMTGHVDDVGELLRTHDVLVSCSITPEPFGQVVVQGLGAGMPVIASAEGGPLEILTGDSGRLVPPGDAHAIADAIEELMLEPAVLSELEAGALRRAQRFEDAVTISALDAILTSYLNSDPRGGAR